jgi:hypothetical protein
MMQTDFYDAYQRHWKDAEFLYADSRLPNADQLYGYSAECGIKCLMKIFGRPFDPAMGNPPKKDRVHIDQLWTRYMAFMNGIGMTRYMLFQSNPFDNWNISDRYAHEDGFTQTHVERHKSGAKTIKTLIDKAILEGRLII